MGAGQFQCAVWLAPPEEVVSGHLTWTTSQAARYLGVAEVTVRRWCADGYLGHHRTPGGQLRFSREQLDVFLASTWRDGVTGDGRAPEHLEAARKR